jgi:hypothetical protein
MGRRYLVARELFFDLSICYVTIYGALSFLMLARKEFPPGFDFEVLPLQLRGLLIKMSHGQIPFPALATSITPLLLTSAGMSTRITKVATVVHFCLFVSTVFAVYMKTKSEACVQDGNAENACLGNLVHDFSSMSVVFSIAFFSCVPSAENSNEYLKLLRDGQQADSVLNHILKVRRRKRAFWVDCRRL